MTKQHYEELKDQILTSLIISVFSIVSLVSVTYIQSREHKNQIKELEAVYELQINKLNDSVNWLEKKNDSLIDRIEELEEQLPKWIAFNNATWRVETGNGTSELWLRNNNAGGMRTNGEWHKYDRQEDGLEAMSNLLATYVNELGYNFKAIRYKYCGAHCGDVDYNSFMRIYNEEINKVKLP